jgi:hypothetical protein
MIFGKKLIMEKQYFDENVETYGVNTLLVRGIVELIKRC